MNVGRKTFLLLAILLIAGVGLTTSGCGMVNKLRAKDRLNEGVREFNKGKFDLAQKEFENALELSPDMLNAQLFYARALNARFDQSLTEDLGLQTVKAYEKLATMDPNNSESVDRALAFQANVYKQLGNISQNKYEEYKNLQHNTLLKRADLPTAKPSAKADVYYTIGVDYWQSSYNLSSVYTSKKQPVPPDVQAKMKPLIQKAHEYLQKTIAADPNYANAYYYETLAFREDQKVETDSAKLKKIDEHIKADLDTYKKINREHQAGGGQAGS